MRLGVNIDHVATLRQARSINLLSPLEAAKICEANGADSIVAHLREDRRHIQDRDIFELRKNISSALNLEMSINKDIVEVAMRARPNVSTLVPERRRELTTEGGLEVAGNKKNIKEVIKKLQSCGISVSLFIDPIKKQILAAKEVAADIVELHTGLYAESADALSRKKTLEQIKQAAKFARAMDLVVAAGHGLDYKNTPRVAAIKEIEELNIGYSIICRAVFSGLADAVAQMRKLVDRVK